MEQKYHKVVPLVQTTIALTIFTFNYTTAIPASAGPAAGVGLASEWTQLLNNAELASIVSLEGQSLATQADQLLQQIEQARTLMSTYELMLSNAEGLPDSFVRQTMEPVLRLQGIMEEAGALAQSGHTLDTFLRSGLIADPLFDAEALTDAKLTERYNQWSDTYNNSTQATLSAAQLTLEDVGTEAALIDTITGRFSGANGHMQALQISNELAASVARQLIDLTSITAVQSEQTTLAFSRILAKQDEEEALKRQASEQIQQSIENLKDQRGSTRTINEILGIGQ